MNEKLHALLLDLMSRLIGYFPKLLAGLAILAVGWLLAWLTKRLVIHIAAILKLEQFLGRTRWKAAFEKADVRYGFYNFLGNLSFVSIFLIFFNLTLIAWDLKFLSDIFGNAILLIPRFVEAFVIFGIGWLIARWAGHTLYKVMISENFQYASEIAFYAKVMLIVFFSAIALTELNIAKEIVLIGFSTIFITLGLIAVITVALQTSFFSKSKGKVDDEKNETGEE
jgi:hypothetical protein